MNEVLVVPELHTELEWDSHRKLGKKTTKNDSFNNFQME